MNTTPKPKATKKSRGELVGPPPLPLLLAGEGDRVGTAEVTEVAIAVLDKDSEIVLETNSW